MKYYWLGVVTGVTVTALVVAAIVYRLGRVL